MQFGESFKRFPFIGSSCCFRWTSVIIFWFGSAIFAIVDLPNDSKALALISIPLFFAPFLTLFTMLIIILASISPQSSASLLSVDFNSGQALATLSFNFNQILYDEANNLVYPGLTGFFGWNYETAVVLQAVEAMSTLNNDSSALEDINQVLQNALEFPHSGAFLKRKWPVFWLYSVGDRIGLLGSLYKKIDENVYKASIDGTFEWPAVDSLKTRNLGFGPLSGISFRKRFIWADDVYMGGSALLNSENLIETRNMILQVNAYFKLNNESGFYHGVKLSKLDQKVIDVNGVKWGRANGWILLMMAQYVIKFSDDAEIVQVFEKTLTEISELQRSSGAFGNVIDQQSSPDESSLTSIFVYGVGVYFYINNGTTAQNDLIFLRLIAAGMKSLEWLNNLKVQDLSVSNTCGAAPLSTDADDYNMKVAGLQEGPALGFLLWAQVGAHLLGQL